MTLLTESQQQAIAARGNVIVVAGAGTGKTSTLVQRCIRLLEEGCSLENILMVTFTEAAAAEMRRRIRQSLQNSITRPETESAAIGRREHFEKQLALLDTARISTLHSFCLQLLRDHFHELGIDPDLTVFDEQQIRPMIQQLLDTIFERHYSGETQLSEAVQNLVRGQGRGSDENIRALILKLHRYSQSLAAPDRWLESQRALFENPQPDSWRGWLVQGVLDWRDLWLPSLREFAGTPAVGRSIDALEKIPTIPTFESVCHALHAIRSADKDKSNWPKGSIGKVRDRIEKFFEEVEFLESLIPAAGTDPLAQDWDLIRHDMLTLLSLAREFSAEFSRAKHEAGGVDFADLEQLALRLLRDPDTGAATATAKQWQRQLEYLFVDEYQDINAAQDAILSALSRDGRTANRFLVGDVKQSIYRFRLTDPTIFRRYEQKWSRDEEQSQRISLSANFRSRPGILNFVNRLFETLMRENVGGVAYESLQFGGEENAASAPEGNAPRVELHLITNGEPQNGEPEANGDEGGKRVEIADLLATEREARLVALRLRELKEQQHEIRDPDTGQMRPATWSDMAVLLRSPARRVEAFAKEFARAGIPLAAARGSFFESTEVSDLICLLKLLDNPLQDIPLLAVLRSPLVGMSLVELGEIRARETAGDRAACFWLAARHFHGRAEKANPARQKLDRFFKQLDRWRESIRQTSLSHCLETALAETHYEILLRASPRGEQRLANVHRLLDLAREYDPYQRQGLFRFLRFIRAQEETDTELEAAPENRDAVRLMSIHKSKGLEFPIVVVAGMGWQFNLRELNESILLDEQFGLCPKITPPGSSQRYASLPHWLARRRQRRELLGEEIRLLYVAMTRARDTLLLTASSLSKSAGNWTAPDAAPLGDRELLSARSGFDWLRLWLAQATRAEHWRNEREGESDLLRWNIYQQDDRRLALADTAKESTDESASPDLDETQLAEMRLRLTRKYPFVSSTEQRAKMSVTELRRRQEEDESEPAPFLRRNAFALPQTTRDSDDTKRPTFKLSAAEIGTAHHRFLQRVSLDRIGSSQELQREADRLAQEKWLTEPEQACLDLPALARFWQSDIGVRILRSVSQVRRELQFTAAFTATELAARQPGAVQLAADDFVVVQGTVDLAVILPGEIWIVDFKTDAITKEDLQEKIKSYEPQLKLYALALSRIYGRPVTECCLYFLATENVVPLI